MKTIVLIFVLFISNSYAKNLSMEEVRTLYQKSVYEENSCKQLIDKLSSYNEANNTCLAAYRACATMIMAKHVVNPFCKLSNFKQGKNLLEKCIAVDKQNIELRFLRYSVQCNTPSFLGYNKSIMSDKTFLINSVSVIKDTQLKQMIISFLKSSTIEKQ